MAEDTGIGYGKPPKDTRFKPGQSGNPAGRPKNPRSLERDLIAVLYEQVTLGEGEGRETLSKQHSILRSLAAKAMEGDLKAAAMVFSLVQRISWDRGSIAAVLEREP